MAIVLSENFQTGQMNHENSDNCNLIDFLSLSSPELEKLEERIENFLCEQGIFSCNPKDKQRDYFETKRSSIHKNLEVTLFEEETVPKIAQISDQEEDSSIVSQVSRSSILSRRKIQLNHSIADDDCNKRDSFGDDLMPQNNASNSKRDPKIRSSFSGLRIE